MGFYIVLTTITVVMSFFVKTQYQTSGGGFNRQINRGSINQPGSITRQTAVNNTFLGMIFLLLAGVSAGRYYVGNDYGEYIEIFKKISLNRSVSSEIGFNSIVKFIQLLCGNEYFIPVFAVFSFATVAFFLKAVREQCDWFGYGFFLFMASGYYLSSLNTLRYYFALAIAVYAAKHAIRKEYITFILWILFASMFHKTVLIVIPVYWFASHAWKKWEWGLILTGCISLILFQDLYRKIIFMIYPYYENSVFDTGETSYLNIIKGVAIILFALLFYRKSIREKSDNRFYFQLNVVAVVLYLFASFIPEISRIAYYFNFFQIILIANLLYSMQSDDAKEKKNKAILSIGIAVVYCVYFAIFLIRAANVSLRIVPYATWIFGQ